MLTAEERVRNVMNALMGNKTFSDEQMKWCSYIREHLVKNLSISEDDFNDIPVFINHGGLGKAKMVFGDNLVQLIQEINYKLAA